MGQEKKETTNLPTLYFDMDGVLATYDYGIYQGMDGKRPPYREPDAHVYRKLKPDAVAIGLFKHFYHRTDACAKILTGLSVPYLISEHMQDKLWWSHDCMDPFSSIDFLCVYGNKMEAVRALKPLTPMDVLIDDWNENLDTWREEGGTAVKYVNRINSERDDMLCLKACLPASENCRVLQRYLDGLCHGTHG